MRDTRRLRERLLLEILAVTVGAAAAGAMGVGCKRFVTSSDPDNGVRNIPSCPHGDWCTSSATAAKLVAPDARDAAAPMGCAERLAWSEIVLADAGLDGGAVPAPFGYAEHQPAQTSAARARSDGGGPDTCCYAWDLPCPGGRPLRDHEDAPVVASLGESEGWCAALVPTDGALAAGDAGALASAWLADALAEHASVASFARATMELMAVGAPSDLVAACQRASLDEIEHARACFAIARRFARRAEPTAPGPLPAAPPRDPSLARVAADTFVEGCVGETVAALVAGRAARACTDDAIRRALERIAEDETEHAALAWRTVAWALRSGGDEVGRALREAAAIARARVFSPNGDATRDAGADAATLARFGRLDAAMQRQAARDAWTEVVAPALEAVRAREPSHASVDAAALAEPRRRRRP